MLNQLSEDLLLQVKKEQVIASFKQDLGNTSLDTLTTQLHNDNNKKAFWINIYNAFFLILKRDEQVGKDSIYKDKLIRIANINFSLDDVEHGILRKYRYKFSKGYLPNFFANKTIKNLAVDEIDFRIHFALNCGANSCPPIAFYSADKIDQQLQLATESFLEAETSLNDDSKTIVTTKLFDWYVGDFGGRSGVKKIIGDFFQKDLSDYRMSYKEYDWTENLSNFQS